MTSRGLKPSRPFFNTLLELLAVQVPCRSFQRALSTDQLVRVVECAAGREAAHAVLLKT